MKNMLRFMPLLAAFALTACSDGFLLGDETIRGRGPVVTEERNTPRFYGVTNATSARVEVLQGPTDRVRVRGQDNIIRRLYTRVEGPDLRIYTDPGVRLDPTDLLVVEVDIRTLEYLQNSGSGEVNAPVVDARRLEVVSSGSGRVRVVDLLADTLLVSNSGSGDVHVDGDVLVHDLRVSGSGDVDARDLLTLRTYARLSGGGDATVRARDRLDVAISGSGSLRYYGSPSITSSLTGSGRLTRLGSW